MTRVAIMQPTYLPWSGYFGLMESVDLFVLLDTVQFARRSWQQRNQIKTASGSKWLTVPVMTKGRRDQTINEVQIDPNARFEHSHRRAIELNYGRAPFFDDIAPELLVSLEEKRTRLSELDIDLILRLRDLLGISTPVMRSSQLRPVGTKADLLASVCEQVGGTEYVSPPGSRDYLDESDAFEKIGMPVRYFEFHHPVYPQLFGEFLPYMSCIDLLLNCGDQSLPLIERASQIT